MRDVGGFGLVVLLLGILVTSIASTAIVINIGRAVDESATEITTTKLKRLALKISLANLQPISTSDRTYETDVGALPTALTDLVTKPGAVSACAQNNTTMNMEGWCGPYWGITFVGESNFTDGWKRTIVYDSGNRKMRSLGPDGVDQSGGGR